MTYEEEKRLSRELFSKYKFIKDIVGLYVEGITWGGCMLLLDENNGGGERIADISADALKTGVQNMLVDGQGDFKLNILGNEHVLTIAMPRDFPMEDNGRPLLWPATRNAKPIETIMSSLGQLPPDAMKFARYLLDDICSGLGIPYGFFVEDPKTFTNTLAIKNNIMIFKGRVKSIRRGIEFGFRQFAKQLYPGDSPKKKLISVEWNEDWCSNDDYGAAYQIFKNQGIVLSTLRDEEIATANWAYQNHMMSRETCERKLRGFD